MRLKNRLHVYSLAAIPAINVISPFFVFSAMLPLAHRQRYEQLQQQLQILHQTMTQTDQTANDRSLLKVSITHLQQFFQAEILTLNADELPAAIAHFVQSYQVEIDKQLRLLAMDAQFLQAARQAATASQRQQQIRDRLETLIRYCNAILGEPTTENYGNG